MASVSLCMICDIDCWDGGLGGGDRIVSEEQAKNLIKWLSYLSDDCHIIWLEAELILGLRPANERQRYFVTTSLIGWAQA